ncbi:MAG TPA: hypothetical protein VLH38_04425 [Patescibacteria group bacterium]|nr:hypothetical protein [Patescibacteria group bacterium]
MVFKRTDAAGVQRRGINKLTLGFASLAAAAVIGTTGIAAAQTSTKPNTGSGYGNTANVELNVHQSGSHNVINIIVNFFQ